MATWIRLLSAIGVAVAAVGLLWVLFGPLPTLLGGADLEQLKPAERIAAISTMRGQIGTVLSAAFVAGGLFYTGKRFVLERDKQFTDRFNTAVDHLGSDNEIVRAGGVRALDRILHDSPTDRNRVLESLTEFVRRHSTEPTDAVPIDVAAAIAALRDRPRPPKKFTESPIGLHGSQLTGANLRGAALTESDLTATVLTEANLSTANLTGTRLNHANLAKANLAGTALRETDLTDADLRAATLTRADLTGATLINTDLRDTDLSNVTGLTNTQIRRAKLDENTQLPAGIDHPLNGPS